ncbi:LysO family transporter [Alkalitalea saponilacus]|uniref:DUF340 domain-containing protein n=1 Tax=Alkalitalea saponilacus TaxID=889453 RepID=A0A1T5HKW9_9BACT|nr:LysO family transporter [Alkalitalea saponilacus]SKC21286.1 Membrane protein of unknown function [Alkalitalea saponilacus]
MSVVIVIGLFLIGLIAGRFFKSYSIVRKRASLFMMWSVYLLLFFLGISVGNNPDVIENIPQLGWQAFLLSLGAVMGSVVFVALLMLLFHRNNRLS